MERTEQTDPGYRGPGIRGPVDDEVEGHGHNLPEDGSEPGYRGPGFRGPGIRGPVDDEVEGHGGLTGRSADLPGEPQEDQADGRGGRKVF